ncbi:MAG: heavy-metal-associated domain-containing protein [Candidatus Kaistia colombiensis]|nr:MAG: heavy-metal-associated domain-containing protein [Kaistia sp.]
MLTLKVKDMSCGHCVATVTKTVKGLDPVAEVATDLASRTVRVESGVDAAAITAALEEAGYPSERV